jgi:hypothetical protein
MLDDQYQRLLRYGSVEWRNRHQPEGFDQWWLSELQALARRDGLLVDLRYGHVDDVEFWPPAVVLLRRNGCAYDAAYMGWWGSPRPGLAAWRQQRFVEDWGDTLIAARRRAGVEAEVVFEGKR